MFLLTLLIYFRHPESHPATNELGRVVMLILQSFPFAKLRYVWFQVDRGLPLSKAMLPPFLSVSHNSHSEILPSDSILTTAPLENLVHVWAI